MKTAMHQYLEQLVEENPNGVPVQIVFKPGGQIQAGALARGPVDGLFKFGTVGRAGPDVAPETGLSPGDMVTIDIVFEPDSVLQVVTQQKTAGVVGRSGIIAS